MQQNLITKIREYLPEIDVNALSFDIDEHPYENDLDQSIENIKIWSHTVLEKAKLPIAVSEAKALTTKYGLETNEGCALQMVVELDAVNKSIENKDASTAALASMKLFEAVWHSSILRDANDSGIHRTSKKEAKASDATPNKISDKKSPDQKLKHYQKTINDLRDKYPHCNVNALRLLAATRLNVSKQELDDLEISPQ